MALAQQSLSRSVATLHSEGANNVGSLSVSWYYRTALSTCTRNAARGPAGAPCRANPHRRCNVRRAALCIALVFVMVAAGTAEVPRTLSYQGVLRDASGNPVADGDYDVTFSLYLVPGGGAVLWTETQSVSAEGGIINATLGETTPLGLAFDATYYLGISVEGEAELTPRTELTSAPYAMRAAVADFAVVGADTDWETSGDDIYRMDGKVGVGTDSPDMLFHINDEMPGIMGMKIENNSTSQYSAESIIFANEDGDWAWIATYDEGNPSYPSAMVIGNNRPGGNLRFQAGGERMRITNSGNVGIGVTDPSSRLDVDGPVEVLGFQMSTGASDGYVLTSDASGWSSWEAPAASPDGDWTIAGSDMYSAVSGDVGVGVTSPAAKLDVSSASSYEAFQVTTSGSPTRTCNIERTSTPSGGNDILQIKVPTDAPDGFQFIECERVGVSFAVDGDGRISSAAGADLNGPLTVDYDGAQAATFTSDYDGEAHVIHAEYTGGDTGLDVPIAVYGESRTVSEQGAGGIFLGGYAGIRAAADVIGTGYRYGVIADAYNGSYNYGVDAWGSGGSTNYGVYAETSGDGTGYGVRGYSHGYDTNYAVSGYAHGGTTNWAGYFLGNVHVNGTLSKTAGSFRIDHPLDPEGQYLQHSFVESPDMMNVYNGNVVLDGAGEAWVELPEWFEVLNRDFRYQLTCIGGFAPVYVAERIRGNRFKVAGGTPGLEVSWQVTGVRQDPYAEANRIEVEVPKSSEDLGKYVSPEAYGRTAEEGIGWVEPRERERTQPSSAAGAERRPRPTTDDGE